MDQKQLVEFAQNVGLMIVELRARLEEANATLASLGAPVINVPQAEVNVEVIPPEIGVDLLPLVEALQGQDNTAIIEAISAVSESVSGLSADEAIGQATEAIASIAQRLEANEAVLGEVTNALTGLTEQSQKIESATQAQFTALAEQMTASNDAIIKALTAPKRILEEGGKPIGVETIVN